MNRNRNRLSQITLRGYAFVNNSMRKSIRTPSGLKFNKLHLKTNSNVLEHSFRVLLDMWFDGLRWCRNTWGDARELRWVGKARNKWREKVKSRSEQSKVRNGCRFFGKKREIGVSHERRRSHGNENGKDQLAHQDKLLPFIDILLQAKVFMNTLW